MLKKSGYFRSRLDDYEEQQIYDTGCILCPDGSKSSDYPKYF